MKRILLAHCLVMVTLVAPALAATNTDVVIFNNGDRLTGEVKSLERGKLRFKTAATDTISIEWDDVAFLTSDQNIQVETENGDRFLGQLSKSAETSHVTVVTEAGPADLDAGRVVFMTPIEAKRIERLDGDFTAGYNFAKASEVQQFRLGLDLDIRAETRLFSLNADMVRSDSEDTDSSQRQSLDLRYRRFRPNRWYTGAVISLDRNDELDIDLRTSIGIGGGRYLRQTNNTTFSLGGGLQFSRENVSSSVSDEDTIEAVISLDWDWFRYDTPELDLSANLQIIPNLTDTGRVRGEFDISLKWEMFEDLFWELSLYDSYDTDPVIDGAEKNDYGIATSLGWEF